MRKHLAWVLEVIGGAITLLSETVGKRPKRPKLGMENFTREWKRLVDHGRAHWGKK